MVRAAKNRFTHFFFASALSCAIVLSAWSQDTLMNNSAPTRFSYLKFSVFPFFYSALRTDHNEALWITLHYESQLRPKSKFTYNLVAEYYSYDPSSDNLTFNGVIDFVIRP